MKELKLHSAPMRATRKLVALLCVAAFLTACGGGGGGGGSSGTPSTSGNASGPSSTPNSNATSPSTPEARLQTVNLSWTAPSARADGTALPLSELSGYKVYIVKESDSSQDKTQMISGGSSTTTQLSLPAPGTYTLALTAIDQNGQESALSNAVTVTLK